MAISGSTSVTVTSYDTLKFTWEQVSQSILDNTTTISWKLELIAGSYGAISSTASKTWTVTINGITKTGSNTVGISNNTTKVLASGTQTIAHNADGTKTFYYSFNQTFNITFSGASITNRSGSGTGVLNMIPKKAAITSAPNFTDQDEPTIYYSIPNGSSLAKLEACISLTGNTDDVPYREIPLNGTSYTFFLTDAERRTLTSAITSGTSRTVKFYIRSIHTSGQFGSDSVSKTFSIAEPYPTLSPTVRDINSTTTALTGDSSTFIKYYSNAYVDSGAEVHETASIESEKIINGKTTLNSGSGTIYGVESNTFYFSVTDSRNLYTNDAVTVDLIDYVKLSCNIDVTNPSTTGGSVSLTISGNYFDGYFGSSYNSLTVRYRYKTNSGSYGSWNTVYPSYDGNTYSITTTVSGLNYLNSYTFQAIAIDELATVYSAEQKVKTTPIFEWGENDFKFNVPVTMPSLEMDEMYVANMGVGDLTVDGDVTIYNGLSVSGSTELYDLKVNGIQYGNQNVLWSGSSHMNGSQSAILSQYISEQPNGIVLVFSLLTDGVAQDASVHSFFVSKKEVELLDGSPHTFLLGINAGFSVIGAKYLYIYDDMIIGNATNTSSGTNSGITFNNSRFVLRYVIGV